MNQILGFTFAACAATGLAHTALAQQYYGPESLDPRPPPAVREDVVPAPPGPPESSVWVRGHYEWNGQEYYWVGGHYIERPVGLTWELGRWVPRDGQWVWIGGYWRR
jgi:hypothetical protein